MHTNIQTYKHSCICYVLSILFFVSQIHGLCVFRSFSSVFSRFSATIESKFRGLLALIFINNNSPCVSSIFLINKHQQLIKVWRLVSIFKKKKINWINLVNWHILFMPLVFKRCPSIFFSCSCNKLINWHILISNSPTI